MTYNLETFDEIRTKGRMTSLSEAMALVDMVRDGDVHHLDGAFIGALSDLACGKRIEYAGATIYRASDGTFCVAREAMAYFAGDPIEALREAESTARPVVPIARMRGWEGAA